MFGGERLQIGADVVEVASVDPDGGQKARVRFGSPEVLPDVSLAEEDGRPGVAAFDGAVRIVPLVDPADGRGGCLPVARGNRLCRGDFFEQVEYGVQLSLWELRLDPDASSSGGDL